MIAMLFRKPTLFTLCLSLLFMASTSNALAGNDKSDKGNNANKESKEDNGKSQGNGKENGNGNSQDKDQDKEGDTDLDLKDVVPVPDPYDQPRSLSQVKTSVRSKLISRHRDNRRGDDKDKDKVTICHKGNTITVSRNALSAHLAHGDSVGTCEVTPKKNK